MADELDQLNQQTQQDATVGTPVSTPVSTPVGTPISTNVSTAANNSQLNSAESEPSDVNKPKSLPLLDLSKSRPLPPLDLSKSKPLPPLPAAGELPKLDLSKSQTLPPLNPSTSKPFLGLDFNTSELPIANDQKSQELYEAQGAISSKDVKKIYDWANRAQVSPETVAHLMTGLNAEQRQKLLGAYAGDTPLEAGIRAFARGTIQDTSQLVSSITTPENLALIAASVLAPEGAVPEILERLGIVDAAKAAKAAKILQGAVSGYFGAQGAAGTIEALKLKNSPEKWSQILQNLSMIAGGAAGLKSSFTPDTKLLESQSKLLESNRKVFDLRMREVDIATKQAEQASAEAERLRQAEQVGTATRQQVIDAENAASKAAANVRVAQEALKQAGAARAEASIKVDRLQRRITAAQDLKARKIAQEKATLAAKAREDFQKAIPPAVSGPASYTPEDYEIARGYLEKFHKNTQEVDSVKAARDALQEAQRGIEDAIKPYIEKYANEPITTNVKLDVHNKLSESPNLKFYDRGMKLFNEYDMKNLTVSKAEEIRNDLNARNRAILKKNFWDVATALKVDPAFAARYAAAESLRDGIYGALEEKGVQGVRELRQDEAAIIRVKNAADRQVIKGDVKLRGTTDVGITRKIIAKGVKAGGGAGGFIIGGIAGHPYVGSGIGREAGAQLGEIIAPGDLTRNQLIRRSMELEVAGIPPREVTEGPVRPQFELPPELQKIYRPPQLEFTNLHNELATHYGEPVTQNSYNELERRFLEDIRDKQKHGIPLDDSEKSLLVKINQQISADALDLQKQLKDYQEQQVPKTPEETALPTTENLTDTEAAAPFKTTDKELPLPRRYAEMGITPRQIRVHEAGHHIVLDAVGFQSIDTISHLHPEKVPGAAAEARWDQSPLKGNDGRIDEDKLKYRFRDVIAQLLGGPVAEELVFGTPIEKNPVAHGDMSRVELLMHKFKLSPEESELVLEEEKNRVKNILTKDGRLDILKKYTRSREANIPDTHYMTAGTTQKMLQEIRQGGQNDYFNNKQTSGRTDRMGRQTIPREERGNEGGNSSSSEEEGAAKGGAAAKGVAATAARQEEPENPKLSFEIPKERTTGDAERDEAIRQGGGIPAGVMKSVPKLGLSELTLFHDPQTGTTLALPSDTVTPELVRQHIMESRSKYAAGNKPKVTEETNEETGENRNDIRPTGAVRGGGQENVPATESGRTEATGQTGKRVSSETPKNLKLTIPSELIAAGAGLSITEQLARFWNRWMGTAGIDDEDDERSLLENPQKYQLMNQGFERLGQILNVPVNMIPSVLWYYQQELDNLRNIPKENQLVEAAAR